MNRFVILFIFCLCQCIETPNKDYSTDSNDFLNFIKSIKDLELDFILKGVEKGKYHEYVWREDGELINNPILKPVSEDEIKYIKSKYSISKLYNYSWIYKYMLKSGVLLLMKQSDTLDVNNWIKINLYSLEGTLLDTLSFAGRKYGFCYMDGMFYKNMQIVTRLYCDIIEDSSDTRNFYATEITKKYSVQETYFNLVEKHSERALFTNVGENRIYARVDTLKFYY